MAPADGAALMAAAVRAAVLAKAPRRTIQAIAAAVASALVHPHKAPPPRTAPREPAGTPDMSQAVPKETSPEALLAALQAARKEQRRRKKERRRTNRLQKTGGTDTSDDRVVAMVEGSAGKRRKESENSAASPRAGVSGTQLALQSGSPILEQPKNHQKTGSSEELAPVPPLPLQPLRDEVPSVDREGYVHSSWFMDEDRKTLPSAELGKIFASKDPKYRLPKPPAGDVTLSSGDAAPGTSASSATGPGNGRSAAGGRDKRH